MKNTLNIIGYLTALLLVTSAVFKINHFPGAGIIMPITGVFLSIYFFVFITNKMKDGSGRYLLAIAVALVNMGIIFKYMHWTGASILILLAVASFCLVYAPMLFMKKIKEEGANKLMYAAGILGMVAFALGIVFKLQHWPAAAELLLASLPLVFLIYFPMYMMSSVAEEKKDTYLTSAFFVTIIGVLLAFHLYMSILSLNPEYLKKQLERYYQDNPTTEQVNQEQPIQNQK